MKLTHRVLRAVAVLGVAATAPLAAALPAHAGAGLDWPPGPSVRDLPPGPTVTEFLPGPSAIAI